MRATYKLKTNNATANDDHLLGDLLQGESTSGADDGVLVDLSTLTSATWVEVPSTYSDARETSNVRTGSNDDVLGRDLLRLSILTGDGNLVRAGDRSGALSPGNLNVS